MFCFSNALKRFNQTYIYDNIMIFKTYNVYFPTNERYHY